MELREKSVIKRRKAMAKVAVLGGGGWAIALAKVISSKRSRRAYK